MRLMPAAVGDGEIGRREAGMKRRIAGPVKASTPVESSGEIDPVMSPGRS